MHHGRAGCSVRLHEAGEICQVGIRNVSPFPACLESPCDTFATGTRNASLRSFTLRKGSIPSSTALCSQWWRSLWLLRRSRSVCCHSFTHTDPECNTHRPRSTVHVLNKCPWQPRRTSLRCAPPAVYPCSQRTFSSQVLQSYHTMCHDLIGLPPPKKKTVKRKTGDTRDVV